MGCGASQSSWDAVAAGVQSGGNNGNDGIAVEYSPSNLGPALEAIRGKRADLWLPATVACRKALSSGPTGSLDGTIKAVIQGGALKRWVHFITLSDAKLRLEAAWALTNVASGNSEQCAAVVAAGALPPMVNLLKCGDRETVEQAEWCLGNVAGDGAALRDKALSAGALPPLLAVLNGMAQQPGAHSVLGTGTWALQNLFKWDGVAAEHVSQALPTAVRIAKGSTDEEILKDAFWALSYMANAHERLVAAPDAGAVQLAASVLAERPVKDMRHVEPVLHMLGNCAAAGATARKAIVDSGVLSKGLVRVLKAADSALARRARVWAYEGCWFIANMASGSERQAQAVVDAGLLPFLARHMQGEALSAAGDAACAVSYVVDKKKDGDAARARAAVAAGCLPALKVYLEHASASAIANREKLERYRESIATAIKGVTAIAMHGKAASDGGPNPHVTAIAQAGMYDIFRKLQGLGGDIGRGAKLFLATYPEPTPQ